MRLPRQVVLDTDVVRFIFRRDKLARFYESRTQGMAHVIALQTYEELRHGACVDGWGDKKIESLLAFLERYEIAIPDVSVAKKCGELRAQRRENGKTLSVADAWIVATTLTLGCPLATHDRGLADVAGLEVIQAPEAGDPHC